MSNLTECVYVALYFLRIMYFNKIELVFCSLVHHIKNKMYATRTRIFFRNRMRSSNSARMNKFDFTTEKIGSVNCCSSHC